LSKPRIAKSTIQTEKIAAILAHVGVPDLIPLPTAPVIEAFDSLMDKLHILLDMRKAAEKEEQELKVREAEAAAQVKSE
jgi:DNA methyltransferase 1-associated protein 1